MFHVTISQFFIFMRGWVNSTNIIIERVWLCRIWCGECWTVDECSVKCLPWWASLFTLRWWSAEHKYVRFWLVHHIMHPSLALLHTDGSPFCFWHQMIFWHKLGNIFRKYHMSVLIINVKIFVWIVYLLCRHFRKIKWQILWEFVT